MHVLQPSAGPIGSDSGPQDDCAGKATILREKTKRKKKVLDLMQALRMIAVTSGFTNSISLRGAKVMQPFLLSFP